MSVLIEVFDKTRTETTIVDCSLVSVHDKTIYGLIGGGNKFTLGTFKSQERALEVFDALRKHIVVTYGLQVFGNDYAKAMGRVKVIFEMPED